MPRYLYIFVTIYYNLWIYHSHYSMTKTMIYMLPRE